MSKAFEDWWNSPTSPNSRNVLGEYESAKEAWQAALRHAEEIAVKNMRNPCCTHIVNALTREAGADRKDEG